MVSTTRVIGSVLWLCVVWLMVSNIRSTSWISSIETNSARTHKETTNKLSEYQKQLSGSKKQVENLKTSMDDKLANITTFLSQTKIQDVTLEQKVEGVKKGFEEKLKTLESQIKQLESTLNDQKKDSEKKDIELQIVTSALGGIIDLSVITTVSKTQVPLPSISSFTSIAANLIERINVKDLVIEIIIVCNYGQQVPFPPYTIINDNLYFIKHLVETNVGVTDSVLDSLLIHKGANIARGDYIVFLPHITTQYNEVFLLDKIVSLMQDDHTIAISGGLIINNENNEKTVFSAGVSANLGKKGEIHPFHKLQGAGYHHYQALKQDNRALCVSRYGMVLKKRIYNEVGGFVCNVSLELRKNEWDGKWSSLEMFEDLDFCMRIGTVGKGIVYLPDLIKLSFAKSSSFELDSSLLGEVNARKIINQMWFTELEKFVQNNRVIHGVRVQWDLYCGCTGVNVEAISYLVALEGKVDLGAVAGADCWCKGFPFYVTQALDRIRQRPIEVSKNNILVWVSHKPPEKYPNFPYRGLVTVNEKPNYVIGRSMSESEPISSDWVDKCNTKVDEIWVPTNFHVESFAKSGVRREKLIQIPESLDIVLWDPLHTTPLQLDTTKAFKFLSVFKWEERKGWDVLLSAYFEEFNAWEDVTLVIHTYLYGDSDPRDRGKLVRNIKAWVDQNGYKERWDEGTLPELVIITDEYPENKMPKLYRACDAFVLSSRGEGWGLPVMEAMAMELPSIATFWSGPTQFMSNETNYLLDVENFISPSKSYAGGSLWAKNYDEKWANPDKTHLKQLMRHVFTERREGKMKGIAARKSVVKYYSQEHVANLMIERLLTIQQNMLTTQQLV